MQHICCAFEGAVTAARHLRLDGNAAGGALREVFARDVTGALVTCVGCLTVGPIGALLEYGQGMGVILRCPACDAAMLRVVHAPGWLRVDVSGISFMTIPESISI